MFGIYHRHHYRATHELLQLSRIRRFHHAAKPQIYGNLDYVKNEIRVIKIAPGRWDDELFCRLKVVSLDRFLSPRYDTLSYTWGSSKTTRTIRVDKQSVDVSANLFIALRALRRTFRTVTIWADALCIDQENNSEKSTQVALMGRIYKQGRQTWVSFGCPDERSVGHEDNLDDQGLENRRIATSMLTWLACHDYWSRVWIVQEIALSHKDPICIFGRHQVPLLSLDTVFSDWAAGVTRS
ncbi:heterokaryon incompatibility protein-domain-containing protein, partial [Massariosphaeria phaeospora]